MRQAILNFACLVAAVLLLAPAAMAQTGRLRGNVIGEDGQPLGGAVIRIHNVALNQTREAKTRDNGTFIHAGLPTGAYQLTCVVNDREAQRMEVRIAFGEDTTVTFDLQAAKQQSDAMRSLASAGELTEEQLQSLSPEQRRAIEQQMEARAEELAGKRELNDAFNAAMDAKKAQQWGTAVENFEKALGLADETNQNIILGNLADCYLQQAQATQGAERETALSKSFETYQKILALDPTDDTTLNNYALALYMGGRYDEGRAELEKAIQANPGQAGMYYYNLGASLLQIDMTNQEGACEAFAKAVEIGTYAPAFFQQGNCLMNKMTMDESGNIVPAPGTKEAFEKYLELDPNGPHAADAQQALQILDMSVQTETGAN